MSLRERMEMVPASSSQRAGKALPSCLRPTVPQLAPGAAWPGNTPSHGSALDSFLQQKLCLISASWRTPSIGLLTGTGDSNKPSVHPVHVHGGSPIIALASLPMLACLTGVLGFPFRLGCPLPVCLSHTTHNQVTHLP